MKDTLPVNLEKLRVDHPVYVEPTPGSIEGCFEIPFAGSYSTHKLFVISGCGAGWDHVSVSLPGKKRCPTWDEMCFIKKLFFKSDELVYQFHPPDQLAINYHPYVLHLWRPWDRPLELPPMWMIAPTKDMPI